MFPGSITEPGGPCTEAVNLANLYHKSALMTIALTRLLRLSIAPLMVAAVVVGCTETETVFVEVPVPAPPFNAPPDSINGFLGYFDAGSCGEGFDQRPQRRRLWRA